MNIAIIIISTVAAIVGISFSIWTLVDTRKRYNKERTKEKHLADD